MLIAFIFRGIGIDLGEQYGYAPFWRYSFGIGSLAATLAQGLALGGLLSGITLRDGVFAGGVWDWLNPFALLITAGVLFGYTMLGGKFPRLEARRADRGQGEAVRAGLLRRGRHRVCGHVGLGRAPLPLLCAEDLRVARPSFHHALPRPRALLLRHVPAGHTEAARPLPASLGTSPSSCFRSWGFR